MDHDIYKCNLLTWGTNNTSIVQLANQYMHRTDGKPNKEGRHQRMS